MAGASAVTVPRSARADPAGRAGTAGGTGMRALQLRVLSSLVLAPIAIAAVWWGWPWLPLLTAVAAAVMAWEWSRLCRVGQAAIGAPVASTGGGLALPPSGIALVGMVVAAVVAAAAGTTATGIVLSAVGTTVVFAVARCERGVRPFWLAAGALWITLPCVLLLWLAQRDDSGRATLLWILAIVWATDIGAYAFGRRIGGPRLAPRWSPAKTWAGLIGGILCAGLAGWVVARLLNEAAILPLVMLSAGLAIVGQFGDLAESAAKRRFGVKDSSDLIPGHGGLLDRLDGLLAVIPAVALLAAVRGGSVLAWP
jgi:phosphatidate cytidylyltransferase